MLKILYFHCVVFDGDRTVSVCACVLHATRCADIFSFAILRVMIRVREAFAECCDHIIKNKYAQAWDCALHVLHLQILVAGWTILYVSRKNLHNRVIVGFDFWS